MKIAQIVPTITRLRAERKQLRAQVAQLQASGLRDQADLARLRRRLSAWKATFVPYMAEWCRVHCGMCEGQGMPECPTGKLGAP